MFTPRKVFSTMPKVQEYHWSTVPYLKPLEPTVILSLELWGF